LLKRLEPVGQTHGNTFSMALTQEQIGRTPVDAFVHISAVERAGMRSLDKDQRISYELETDNRGKTSAVNLQAA
jgi:cold shock CspA family protein